MVFILTVTKLRHFFHCCNTSIETLIFSHKSLHRPPTRGYKLTNCQKIIKSGGLVVMKKKPYLCHN